jgi:hypothetical protein
MANCHLKMGMFFRGRILLSRRFSILLTNRRIKRDLGASRLLMSTLTELLRPADKAGIPWAVAVGTRMSPELRDESRAA